MPSIIVSTRVDVKTLATLIRLYDLHNVKYRTKSGAVGLALIHYVEQMVEKNQPKFKQNLAFKTDDEAIVFLKSTGLFTNAKFTIGDRLDKLSDAFQAEITKERIIVDGRDLTDLYDQVEREQKNDKG